MRLFGAVFFALLLSHAAFGQDPTIQGVPPHQSLEIHQYEIINLADLGTTIRIPVLDKKGAIPFSYALTQQTNLTYPPVFDPDIQDIFCEYNCMTPLSYRLMTGTPSFSSLAGPPGYSSVGYVSYQVGYCPAVYGFLLVDTAGASHEFPRSLAVGGSGCAQTATAAAVDGSGITLAVNYNSGNLTWTAYDLSGNAVTGKLNDAPPPIVSDPNGNKISASVSSTNTTTSATWTDTLGTTALTSAISNGMLPSDTYSYTDGSGNTGTYTVNWTALKPKIAVGCSWDGLTLVSKFPTSVALPDGTMFGLTYEESALYPGTITGRIGSLTLPTGGIITYTYPTTNCSDGTPASMTRTTSDGTWSYAHVPPSKCNGTTCSSTATTTVTDPLGNQTVYTFAEAVCANCQAPVWFFPLYLVEKQVYNGSISPGNLSLTETHCYNGNLTNCSTPPNLVVALPLTQEDIYTYLPGVANPSFKELHYNSVGLVTEEKAFDFGASTPTYDKLISYGSFSGGSCVSFAIPMYRVCESQTNDGSGKLKSLTRYSYDSKGNLLESDDLVSGSTFLKKTYTYDTNGTLKTFTDANGTITKYTNGACNGLFPTATNVTGTSVNMSTSEAWDCNGAVQTSFTDQNGDTTMYEHQDHFWRLTQLNYPDGGETEYSYNDTASPPNITESNLLEGSRWITTQTNLDGYGRPFEAISSSDPQGPVYSYTTYDALDRVSLAYNPTRCNPPTTNCGESTWGYNMYAYDALDRTTQVTYPDGSVWTASYNGNCTTVTDEALKARKSCFDGLGRLTTGWEDPAGLNYETDYTYDALDNLLTVNQKGGSTNSVNWRTRTFTYDSMSRLLTSSNPETGPVTYAYDSDASCPSPNSFPGSLVKKLDARGIRTCIQYDGLKRVTSKNFSDGTAAVGYIYDQPTNIQGESVCYNIGRRTSMTDGPGSESWCHDKMGRILAEQRTTNGITMTTTYTYNLDGSLATLTYPSGRVVTYTTDSAGRPSQAQDNADNINYVTGTCANGVNNGGTCYAPQGSVASLVLGKAGSFGGITLANSYNTRVQPNEMKASTSAATAMDLVYSFIGPNGHSNGNVIAINNNKANDSVRSENFSYDSLNRIVTAQTTSTHATSPTNCWAETYTYDAWGNLYNFGLNSSTQSAYIGCSQEGGLQSSAAANNQLNGTPFSYDASGNMRSDAVNSYTWDAESKVKSASGVNYTYDGDGKRVEKSNGTIYWYGGGTETLDESNLSGNITDEYVFFGGKRVSHRTVNSGAIYYYVEDFLGTSRVMTTSAGVVCYEADFYPYGGERVVSNTCEQKYKLEGVERDAETANDDFAARYYSSSFGRWLSPDWSASPEPIPYADLSNPQTLNLYAMAHDNPETFADLEGHDNGTPESGFEDLSVGDFLGLGIQGSGITPAYRVPLWRGLIDQLGNWLNTPSGSQENAQRGTGLSVHLVDGQAIAESGYQFEVRLQSKTNFPPGNTVVSASLSFARERKVAKGTSVMLRAGGELVSIRIGTPSKSAAPGEQGQSPNTVDHLDVYARPYNRSGNFGGRKAEPGFIRFTVIDSLGHKQAAFLDVTVVSKDISGGLPVPSEGFNQMLTVRIPNP